MLMKNSASDWVRCFCLLKCESCKTKKEDDQNHPLYHLFRLSLVIRLAFQREPRQELQQQELRQRVR